MKIILLKNKQKLGSIGDIIKVKSGYARNFLIPNGFALLATLDNINFFEYKKNALNEKIKIRIHNAKLRVKNLQSIGIINIISKAGEKGKLFGSIGNREISNAINLLNFKIDKNEIYLQNGPIRFLGKYQFIFKPYKEISCFININVISKK